VDLDQGDAMISRTIGAGGGAVSVKTERNGNIELNQNGSQGQQTIYIEAADASEFRYVIALTDPLAAKAVKSLDGAVKTVRDLAQQILDATKGVAP
jgi:hypothetical protein